MSSRRADGSPEPLFGDEDLAAAKSGDAGAISKIYERWAPPLLRFFLSSVGDRPTAEDLTGSVFVAAIESLPRFEGPAEGLGRWLFTIARHDLYDLRRHQVRWRTERLDDRMEEAAAVVGADDPEEVAIRRVDSGRAVKALAHLSPDQRDVLLYRLAGGLSASEVAEVLGKTVGAVKSLQHRGLATLNRLLDEGQTTEPTVRPYPIPPFGRSPG